MQSTISDSLIASQTIFDESKNIFYALSLQITLSINLLVVRESLVCAIVRNWINSNISKINNVKYYNSSI